VKYNVRGNGKGPSRLEASSRKLWQSIDFE
jgi:hypothetical protein